MISESWNTHIPAIGSVYKDEDGCLRYTLDGRMVTSEHLKLIRSKIEIVHPDQLDGQGRLRTIEQEELPPTKAWRVTIKGWPEFEMIWPGSTRGRAKSAACYDCQSSGWSYTFIDFRAVRAPEFDEEAAKAHDYMPFCLGWRDGDEVWGVLK